jgi:gliding motility-associated lipoprotein GldH
MKLNRIHFFITNCFIAALLFCVVSCNQINVFEKNINIPSLKWQSNFSATGVFDIVDTTVEYKVYLVLRHTDAYEYNNIWLNVGLQQAGDKMQKQKLNITLGNDANGWDGIGMNDNWEVRKQIDQLRLKKGTYNFEINQIMRNNPLPNIMNVGLRVEKAK